MASSHVLIVGAGPAGLFAAERLSDAGLHVTVAERMPSPARKFLLAGRGGLNLTHSEPIDAFRARYGEAAPRVSGWLDRLSPADLNAWAEGLGQSTFIGSSGRVFPKAMKASPLLRAWLARLADRNVTLRTRWTWAGQNGVGAAFDTPDGPQRIEADAVVLTMGGASWPRLGSDGGWREILVGVEIAPFRPTNAGVNVAWSEVFAGRFAGQPLKTIALTHGDRAVRGEAMVARYGLEGGAVYALSADLRRALDRDGTTTLTVDLRPDLTVEALADRLARGRGKDSLSNWLRKAAGLSPVAVGLLREIPGEVPVGPDKLARRIKAVRLLVTDMQGLERAISSAGGVRLDQVDDRLMFVALPGVFVAGEMLDWEAPTGGYLLQACFASGAVAADGVLAWLGRAKCEA
jgi:uncharacterized flavoprotein (TIGR03862 family)